ncbi:hypothetical protein [Lactobacillus terrae]|uniref:hypothetical protein n=1 Tax=Lactobacillus terrae TaxID=2269374 RepID=UPI000C1B6BF2|nr:hypothetical protein [Lactobacillus terrae]
MSDLYLNNSLVKKDFQVGELFHAENMLIGKSQTVELKNQNEVIFSDNFTTSKPIPSPIEIASVSSTTSDDVTIVVKLIDSDQKLSVVDKDNKVIATANTGVKTIHIKGLKPGTKYSVGTYTLKATNSFNDEVTTNIPEFTVAWKPPVPVISKVEVPDSTHVKVTVSNLNPVDKLQIKDTVANKILVNGVVGSSVVSAPGLTPGKKYATGELIIFAKNDNATGDSTNIPEFTTPAS